MTTLTTVNQYRGLFITGTDTNVGKTVITAALASILRDEGIHVGVWKPVQSGAMIGSGQSDAERLLLGSGIQEAAESIASYSYAAPLTPLLAARLAGVHLTMMELEQAGRALMSRYDSLLIEGAGGVAVPLTEDGLVADFMKKLGVPALIIARPSLGTINHTLLTIAYLKERSIPIVGIILNDGSEELQESIDPSIESNALLIEQYSGVKVLGRIPRLSDDLLTEPLSAASIRRVRNNIQLEPIKQALTLIR